jgi:methionyl-tRNA synthetase
MITIDDFAKIELRVATVLSVEHVEGSEKLLKLQVDLGDEQRQILSGIAKTYTPESLIGKQVVIIANLAPRAMMGMESNGMILAASGESGPVVVVPETKVPAGAGVK